jgi:hypothetical protein
MEYNQASVILSKRSTPKEAPLSPLACIEGGIDAPSLGSWPQLAPNKRRAASLLVGKKSKSKQTAANWQITRQARAPNGKTIIDMRSWRRHGHIFTIFV